MGQTDRPIALDLDGTLIDARRRQVGVAAEALASLTGERLDERRFWRAKRLGANTAAAVERLGYDQGVATAVAARWAERIESDDWLARDCALPGVRGALGGLSVVTVITARRRAHGARVSLSAAGLDAFVGELIVVDPADAAREKAAALSRIRAVGFIGDTDSDGAAAASAGVPFAAVATGQRSAGYLQARGYPAEPSLRAALRVLQR